MSILHGGPPYAPPHDKIYKKWKYSMWPITKLKNDCFPIIIHAYMSYAILSHLNIGDAMEHVKTKKRDEKPKISIFWLFV